MSISSPFYSRSEARMRRRRTDEIDTFHFRVRRNRHEAADHIVARVETFDSRLDRESQENPYFPITSSSCFHVYYSAILLVKYL